MIPVAEPVIGNKELEYVTDAVQTGWISSRGKYIKLFEDGFAKFCGTKYASSCNSGTAAIHLALLALDIKEGDEVIVPASTYIASANPVKYVGATPVFVDSKEDTWTMDPEKIEEKITEKTKAIMAVHLYGMPCDMDPIMKIAKKHNLYVIEDAAEAHGSEYDGKKVGSIGDIGCFSFFGNKVITTGEGGAIVTNSGDIYNKLKLVRSHGRLDTQDYFSSAEYLDYVTLGYNFRMPNIIAALGITQLGKIDEIIKRRRGNAHYMGEKLSIVKEIKIPFPPKDSFHIYQMYSIEVKNGRETRDKLAKYLNENGIMTKIYFEPIHQSHFYKNELGYKDKLPVTEEMALRILTLPMYPSIERKEIDYIADSIAAFFSKVEVK